MNARDLMDGDSGVFALVWGLMLGDDVQVVDGKVRTVFEGFHASNPIDEEVLHLAELAGLIEFIDLPDGTVKVKPTEKGRFHTHASGVRRMGRQVWEERQRDGRWLLKFFDVRAAIREFAGTQTQGGK